MTCLGDALRWWGKELGFKINIANTEIAITQCWPHHLGSNSSFQSVSQAPAPHPPSRFSWPSLAVISALCSYLHTSNPSLCPQSHFPSSSGTVCLVSVLCSAFSLAQKSCSVSLLIGLPICPCLCPHGIPRDLFENVDLNKDPEVKTPWLFPWLSGSEIKDGPFTWPPGPFSVPSLFWAPVPHFSLWGTSLLPSLPGILQCSAIPQHPSEKSFLIYELQLTLPLTLSWISILVL